MSATSPESTQSVTSTAAQALAAAGDAEQARDVGALDEAALAAQKRLGATRRGLVERLIYGPLPAVEELASGASIGRRSGTAGESVVAAAIDCPARGRAFTADEKLSAELRRAVAAEKAYGFTVPSEFGGAGATYGELALTEEALAANGLGALAVEVSGELTIGAASLLGYGTDEQRKTFLPMLAEGRLMGFALTEVGVGVNAKKVQAYVELDEQNDCWRLNADGARAKFYITNATHGGLVGLVARIGQGGKKVGLFVTELPETDVERGGDHDWSFRCESTGVSAFVANYNSKLEFENYPIPRGNQIQADGVEVLFYCLRMGRCMLAAMSAGYQRMLAADAAHFARQRDGVGGRVIKHELPRLNLGRCVGGALQARALSHLSLQQDADGVDLAGLRDLTKSAASGTAMESQVACEHVLGGRSFHTTARVSDARANLHVFGIVEGEDDLILMGMIKDVCARFTDRYMAGMLGVIQSINVDAGGEPVAREDRIVRIGPATVWRHPKRCAQATLRLLGTGSFWSLVGWVARNAAVDVLRLPGRLVPTAWLPRYRSLPRGLRGVTRWAERKLRGRRWTYLGINLWFQLELTRAQIPLQRLGKTIEHLVSIVALAFHVSQQDRSQQRVATLQCELLRQKFDGIRILSRLRSMDAMRGMIEEVGRDLERGECTMISDVEPQSFAQPWE
ncbi:MAG: acyl-CoA/acyl-ACP dehydrogenase [Planctomycetes bacterium]|nr:acyl-CoA/acyl-ACP dehydrogenase [Planctomycetota bacterium]